jgi:cystathionine gamma-synthase
MTGFGGVISFEVAGDFDATRRFIDSVKIPYHAPSFGGCESIIDQPAIMSYWYGLFIFCHIQIINQSKRTCC